MEEEQLVPLLKKSGLRVTAQRVLILKTIISLNGHPSAEDIHRELPYMSLPTIYSNLKLFVKLGILNELPYGDGKSKYEMFKTQHYHVICKSCGKMVDLEYPHLKEVEHAAAQITHFKVNTHYLGIYGVCTTCQDLQQR
ncbi:Fur family transcriptional regulator [Bacillus swezeyi]|uniref:Transcriptional repressor n=1 Tax=Bacillus swezeyi TaxID=1925020 RepID=A0A1R1QWZ5_9BACI|nr:Fur family transcriptional regulator [Bacillus swezeyi]KAA6451180.1 transcriptional repressor [Bacillus swezeyi]KAA6474691.1 transcriptional repressor [Bacillus swezeyi]MEC1259100.1 Fur family transcriptional regulator [Bacillus swezeyi]MED1737922.1 Fur family transcriptional regulator [Bacillus swezeyi]MED2927939.1 Fur family transcriptional regulator [Bacillus swezeyi]